MGMSEDDRIRSKNRYQTEAFDIYEGLKMMGYDHIHMLKYIEFTQKDCTDFYRSEVYRMVINIIRRTDESNNNS